MTGAADDPRTAGKRIPYLRIVRGDPSLEEVAALTAVLTARVRDRAAGAARDGAAGREQPASRWADRSLQLRRPLPRGRDAWRAAMRHL